MLEFRKQTWLYLRPSSPGGIVRRFSVGSSSTLQEMAVRNPQSTCLAELSSPAVAISIVA